MGGLKISPIKRKLKAKVSNLPKLILALAIFCLLFLIILLAVLSSSTKNKKIEKEFFVESNNIEVSSPTPQINLQLERIFNEKIPSLKGRWAVVVKDMNSQKTYSYNENEIFSSASLYKLTVMWATFEEIKKGTMKLDDPIAGTTVKDALNAMITISDNETALALAEKIGWKNIENLMKKEGIEIDLTSTNSPFISASAVEHIFERIYLETAVDKDSSIQMKRLLFAQQINDRIPKYLPPEIAVGHKTGELDNVKHDAGIVIGRKSNYIFVFLTETEAPATAAEETALLSKEIFDALDGN